MDIARVAKAHSSIEHTTAIHLCIISESEQVEYLDIPLPAESPAESVAEQPKTKKFKPVREWDRGKGELFFIFAPVK